MRRPLLAVLLVVLVIGSGAVSSQAAPPLPQIPQPRPDKNRAPEFVPGRVLVRFAAGSDNAAAVARDHGLALGRTVGRTGFVVAEPAVAGPKRCVMHWRRIAGWPRSPSTMCGGRQRPPTIRITPVNKRRT